MNSSPRPWTADDGAVYAKDERLKNHGPDHEIADCTWWADPEKGTPNHAIAEANAELIVRAVNAYDDLVSALEAALDYIGNGYQPPELIAQCRAALDKAGK